MEMENFNEILNTVRIAKQLCDIGRSDTMTKYFGGILDYDSYWHNMYGFIESLFSGYYSAYDDYNDEERMIFTDDVISNYYVMAWEYGKRHRLSHEQNPYVKAAEHEVQKYLTYCYSLSWRLCGYTRTEATAQQSKLIIYSCTCDSCGLDQLAYSLLMVYSWFKEQCAELEGQIQFDELEEAVMAA